MADDRHLLVWMVCFWTLLTFMSYAFEVQLSNMDVLDLTREETEQDRGFFYDAVDSVLNFAGNIPIVSLFVPLMRILSFQYTETVPVWISIFLQSTLFFSAYLVYSLLRKG